MIELKEVWKIMSELWEWCSENPGAWKEDWPGWEKYGIMHFDSPCCEYVISNFGLRSDWITHELCEQHCPALEIWPDGCEHEPSPFLAWDRTFDDSVREAAAKVIADFAKKKYEEVSK